MIWLYLAMIWRWFGYILYHIWLYLNYIYMCVFNETIEVSLTTVCMSCSGGSPRMSYHWVWQDSAFLALFLRQFFSPFCRRAPSFDTTKARFLAHSGRDPWASSNIDPFESFFPFRFTVLTGQSSAWTMSHWTKSLGEARDVRAAWNSEATQYVCNRMYVSCLTSI